MSAVDPNLPPPPPDDSGKNEEPLSSELNIDVNKNLPKVGAEGSSLQGRVEEGIKSPFSFEERISPKGVAQVEEIRTLRQVLEETPEAARKAALQSLGLSEEHVAVFLQKFFDPRNILEGKNGFALAKDGLVVTCLMKDERLSLYTKERIVDVDTGMVTHNPGLKPKELRALHKYVLEHKDGYINSAQSSGKSIYLPPKKTGVARAIHFTPEGQVFIHMNKKSISPVGDRLVGEGRYKIVTIAMNLETGKLYASSSMSPEEAAKEIEFFEKFAGEKGFPQIESKVAYTSEKEVEVDGIIQSRVKEKVRVLTPLAERGSLSKLVEDGALSLIEKKVVAKRLIEALAVMESKGVLHRDLHLDNILITGEGEDIQPIIIDFGLSTEDTDSEKKQIFSGTIPSMSPEYIEAVVSGSQENIEKATAKPHEVWAIGVCLDELFYGRRHFAPREGFTVLEAVDYIRGYHPRREPKEGSLEHLIWSMLRANPAERITTEGLLAHEALRGIGEH